MRRQHWWLPLVALVFATNWISTLTLPVPDEELDTSTKLLGSSVVTSVSVVTGSSDSVAVDNGMKTSTADRMRIIPSKDMPGSPADLMRPDKFQFYTLNKDGNVVTKQMTEQEIKTLIAAGGGHMPAEMSWTHEPQSASEAFNGGTEVADVVHNVQNVLKGELNKPAAVMTSMPTIPGHANTEWSSILPAILGLESDTVPVSEPPPSFPPFNIYESPIVDETTFIKMPEAPIISSVTTKLPVEETESSSIVDYEGVKRPNAVLETESHTKKPMIQVPVITVDQKLPSHQEEEDSISIFQMLNTISTNKINVKNKPQVDDKPKPVEEQYLSGQKETSAKPEPPLVVPGFLKEPISHEATIIEERLPEMIQINFNSGNVEPTVISPIEELTLKPESGLIISDKIYKIPESESSTSIGVIFQSHSTLVKLSGHEKAPIQEPSKTVTESTTDIKVFTEMSSPEKVTKKVFATTELRVNSTTPKAEVIEEQPDETSTEHGLFAEGVSFFGNLPQTASAILSDLISNETPSKVPINEDADVKIPFKTSENITEPVKTTNVVQSPEAIKLPTVQTNVVPAQEQVSSAETPVNQEPVYQIIPAIIPVGKIPSHDTLPSEASSIEHIIETLNDPAGNVPGTVTGDRIVINKLSENKSDVSKVDLKQSDSQKPSEIVNIQTSTAATISNAASPAESSSIKPMEQLPTELADSLTSMISQISETMPSALPISEHVGFDTIEKKNVINVNAEEPNITEGIQLQEPKEVSKISEAGDRVPLLVQAELEKSDTASPKIPDSQSSATTIGVKGSINSFKDISSTERPVVTTITTQSSNLDSSTTPNSAVPLASDGTSKFSTSDMALVAEQLEVSSAKPEKMKPETDEVQAASDIITDKIILPAISQESVKTESIKEPSSNVPPRMEEISTVKTTTTITSSSPSIESTVPANNTRETVKIQTDSPAIVQDPLKLEDQKKESPVEIEINENNTELTIVRIDITEGKPTGFHNANDTQSTNNANNGEQSPLVRIKLTNPVAQINNMIESANLDAILPPVVPLLLPETESLRPNNIASGLIAGYPSSTTQATASPALNLEVISTTIEPVKFFPLVEILGDAPASTATGNVTMGDVKISEDLAKNNTKSKTTEILGTIKGTNVPDHSGITEVPTSKNVSNTLSEKPLGKIDWPKETVLPESSDGATTIAADTLVRNSTDEPIIKELIAETTTSKSAEVEVSTISATHQAILENRNASSKIVENVTLVVEESTTTKSALAIDEAPERPMMTATSPISKQQESSEKLKENSIIIEISATASSKAEMTTKLPELLEMEIKSQNVPAEPVNLTKSEVSVSRIDLPEKNSEKAPTKVESIISPALKPTLAPKKPLKDGGIHTFHTTQNLQAVTTMQSPVEPAKDNIQESSNVSLQTSTVSTVERSTSNVLKDTKTTTKPIKEKLKIENDAQKPQKIDTDGESTLSKIPVDPLSAIFIPQETQEIRIQVNDTAVLVTNQPVSVVSSQKLGDTKKPSALEEQPTTTNVGSVTKATYVKQSEKIQFPVLIKVSELSSSHEGAIPIGDEENEKTTQDGILVKVADPKKPIKKDTDGDSLPITEKDVLPDSSIKPPSGINDHISTSLVKDSNAQSSAKVEITTTASSKEPPNTTDPFEVQEKTTKAPEKETSIRIVTERPIAKPEKPVYKTTMNIKKDDAPARHTDDQWTLIPQQVYPALTKKNQDNVKQPITTEAPSTISVSLDQKNALPERAPVSLDHPQSASGLDSTVNNLETDITYFANLCNELAFSFWTATNKGLSTARSLAVSPFGMTSMLAMVFLGARGPTSDQMNEVLKLDDMASFNPHLVFQNVTDAVSLARNQGIANAAFVREIFADRSKVRKLMPFYKEQAQQFYDGVVAEVNFATISDLVRRRTNLMIRKQTGGRIKDFVRTNTVPLRSPLAALSANVFQTNCNSSAASSEGRDGELYFAVSPAVRQRKLVPVPSTVWRAGVLAGYEPGLDGTAIALGGTDKLVSTIFVIPGQQGHTALGDTLELLEQRLVRGAIHDGSWNKLLKVLIPRPGLELQVPKFSHRSVINATAALKRMGLGELFSKQADLKGINGIAKDLHLADVLQMNLFSTCGDENIINGRHHVEVYPGSPLRNARGHNEFEGEKDESLTGYSSNEEDSFEGSALPYVPHQETRSARHNDGTEKQRLKLDRPFLYFVRHNPTGLILHMGRFNPRLMP